MKISHVIEGWSKAMGLMQVSPAEQEMSNARLEKCKECPFSRESKFLKFIKDSGHNIDAYYCTICKCPVNEKSLVNNETCPKGLW